MHGDPTDNNATLFAQGYDGVLQSAVRSGQVDTLVAKPAGTWDPPTALTEFEQAFTAHKNINAALIPNDENGAPIITYLQSHGVKPNTFPTTGQDATLTGLQNILVGLPVRNGLQADLHGGSGGRRARDVPARRQDPAGLAGQRHDRGHQREQARAVGAAEARVGHAQNMNDTVIKDNFVPPSQLCAGPYAAACKKAGIS